MWCFHFSNFVWSNSLSENIITTVQLLWTLWTLCLIWSLLSTFETTLSNLSTFAPVAFQTVAASECWNCPVWKNFWSQYDRNAEHKFWFKPKFCHTKFLFPKGFWALLESLIKVYYAQLSCNRRKLLLLLFSGWCFCFCCCWSCCCCYCWNESYLSPTNWVGVGLSWAELGNINHKKLENFEDILLLFIAYCWYFSIGPGECWINFFPPSVPADFLVMFRSMHLMMVVTIMAMMCLQEINSYWGKIL